MNQATRWLLQGIDQQTKKEKALIKKYPIEIPSRDDQFREAIQIIETYYMVTNNPEASFNFYPNDQPKYIKAAHNKIAGDPIIPH